MGVSEIYWTVPSLKTLIRKNPLPPSRETFDVNITVIFDIVHRNTAGHGHHRHRWIWHLTYYLGVDVSYRNFWFALRFHKIPPKG